MTVNELIQELLKLLDEGKIQGHTPVLVHNTDIGDYTSCFEVLINNKQVYLE